MMFKERQTLDILVQSMRALTLARKEQNEVGEVTVGEIRHRIRLYSFFLKAQRKEMEKCINNECDENGYDKKELNELSGATGREEA